MLDNPFTYVIVAGVCMFICGCVVLFQGVMTNREIRQRRRERGRDGR